MTTTTHPALFDMMNDSTGFANGDEFADAAQVRAYFTPESQREMFGRDAVTDAGLLTSWAEAVIAGRWHMRSR